MRVNRYFTIPRPALAVLVPMGAAAAMAVPTSSALAACDTTGVAPATVTVTCAVNTVTTNTTNSTSPTMTSDRIQSFNADLVGQVNAGVTVSGFGLELDTTKANGSVSFTNNGTISLPSGNAVLTLTGKGGGVSYSGNGNVTGTGPNTFGLELVDSTLGAGAMTVNATGGSITAVGNSVFGLGVFTSNTGGINVTTSGGHSIDLVNTFSGTTNRGMFINNNGTSGDIVIVSGSHIFASGGASSLGAIIGMDVSQGGAGNINVTSNGVIDLSGTTQAGSSGIFLTHQGTSGNIAATINANIIAGTNGAGIQATFSNAGNSGTAGFTIANGVTISGGVGLAVDGGAGTHAVTVTTGTGSVLSSKNESIRLTGANTNLALTNAGSITSAAPLTTAVSVAGHLTGSNTGSITGASGIVASTAGSNFINAGTVAGLAGSAIQFTGAGNVLTLQNGTSISGSVNGGTAATFQLGGTTGSPFFDVTLIGVQYVNFSTFSKIDAGVWALVGTNPAVMPWTVSGGTLNVNGTMANSTMTVNGGTLGGTGTVGNTQINGGGTFAPGSGVPGSSMTVSGSLALASSAFYMVQLSPSTSSFANVTGTATLGGATVNAVFAPGSYVAKQYTILTAANVGGTFNPAVANTNLPSGFITTLSYDPTHAFLNLGLNFTPPAGPLNGNQQNVANALINFFNTNGGIPMVFGTLTPARLTQTSGETATGTQQTTFDAMSQFMGLLTDPFIAGRGDGATGGAGATPFAEESNGANAYAAKDTPRTKSERDAYAAIYRKAPPPVADPFAQRWSVWAAGYGGSQTTDGNAAPGSNTTTSRIFGTAVGADYRLSPSTLAGFALAGGGTNFSIANALGTGRSDLFQAGAYLRHAAGPAYFSAVLAYGWQDITTDRTLTIAGVDQLRAKFNANAFSGRAEGGYRFLTPWMGVAAYAAGQFTTFDLPAYAEHAIVGANTFALAYAAKDVTATRSELGVRTDKSWAMRDSIFTLRGRFAWAHDFSTDRNIGATFQTLPGASFVVNGAAQSADKALATASAEVKWINGFSLAGTFEGEFSNTTRSYAGKGVVRYAW